MSGVVGARRNGKSLRLMEQFNEVCPVGTPIIYWPGERTGEGHKSVTRSAAWMLGGHTPVVLVEGYPGGIALSHVMGYTPARSDPNVLGCTHVPCAHATFQWTPHMIPADTGHCARGGCPNDRAACPHHGAAPAPASTSEEQA